MNTKQKRWIRIRIYVTGICFVLVLGVLFLRAYQLQILEGKELSSLAKEGYTGRFTLPAQRGTIFDRNGRELALSIDVDSIYCYPKRVKDPLKAATLIANALHIKKKGVLKKLQSPRSFVWIKRKVTPEEIIRVRGLNLTGIGFTKEGRRYYPSMETGAHVIGFASQDNKGLEGIELKYNAYLEGQEIRLNRIRDALGRSLVFDGPWMEKQGPFDLVLTLDKEISYKALKALKKAVKGSGASSGVCIVIRPQTGEILAMEVVPEFNPNVFWRFRPYEWRNRAVTDCFEPGSTLKAFLLAAALEEGVVTAETVLNSEKGYYSVGNSIIHDRRPFGMLKVSEIIKFSSNIGAIKIGQRLGAERFHHYLKRFGFGERAGIDFPGERKGNLKSIKDKSLIAQNTRYFGQGITVSPLQLAMAFGAIANGGHLMRPYLVKSIVDQKGKIIREFYPVVRRDVISSKIAKKVRGILEGVVRKGGTGTKAAIDGYRVAGKTGTAQKVDPIKKTYSDKRFVAFFCGFVPSETPAIVILVALDEPKRKPYGGIVAAPVFSEVGGWTLTHLNVIPSFPPVTASPASQASPLAEPARHSPEAQPTRLTRLRESNGGHVVDGQSEAARARALRAEGDEEIVVHSPDLPGSIPDLKGLGVRDVLRKARRLGLEVVVKGSGLAVEQSPVPGTPLKKQRTLKVLFRPPS
ncbi:MAG: penicillin-binding transpeptidase domain-containing protein [Desulfatiglandales bacterium]